MLMKLEIHEANVEWNLVIKQVIIPNLLMRISCSSYEYDLAYPVKRQLQNRTAFTSYWHKVTI